PRTGGGLSLVVPRFPFGETVHRIDRGGRSALFHQGSQRRSRVEEYAVVRIRFPTRQLCLSRTASAPPWTIDQRRFDVLPVEDRTISGDLHLPENSPRERLPTAGRARGPNSGSVPQGPGIGAALRRPQCPRSGVRPTRRPEGDR